jgi:hypothetical protein
MSSCSDSKETTTGTQTKETKSASSSMFGKSTEEKVDDFLTDYVSDLKSAMDERDDKKAIALLKEMKEEYASRAVDLKPEVEAWEKSLSDTEEQDLSRRMESKPYFKDLVSIGFNAMGRFSKNEELQKAFEDLNSSVDIATTDDDTMKDEYPVEEEMAEETSN